MLGKILRPFLSLITALCLAVGQPADDVVRVRVTMNPDGSKTVYQSMGANHQLIATTTGPDGKARGKIIYTLDAAGRYESGEVFAANGARRFHTLYKYDAAGRLAQETQLGKENSVLHKIVYTYNADGQQTGYAIYDGAGRLLGRTTAKKPGTSPSASAKRSP